MSRLMMRMAGIVFVAVALVPSPASPEACHAWPIESIYDGDTLRATVAGQSTRVRLLGLDTPELPPHHQCAAEKEWGYAARDRLRELAAGAGSIAFCPDGKDRYGRTLARMVIDGEDVAGLLIAENLAREYGGGRRQGWCDQSM